MKNKKGCTLIELLEVIIVVITRRAFKKFDFPLALAPYNTHDLRSFNLSLYSNAFEGSSFPKSLTKDSFCSSAMERKFSTEKDSNIFN